MDVPAIPDDEAARLQELRSYGVLDTDADPHFDDISELARRVAGTEIGIVSLVDENRQWFKSCVGAPLGQQETPRQVSFCGHTILQRGALIINDALQDSRFADNPLVTGDPGIRFYAGFPLITSNGFVLGSLCAISRRPHQLSAEQIDSLGRLASLTVQQLQVLRESALLSAAQEGLGEERLAGRKQEQLSSLERLISRDQMVQMLALLFGMGLGSPFTLLRCRFRDYERVNATLGSSLAEQFINEAARRVLAAVPKTASVARFAESELVVLLPYDVEEAQIQDVAERLIAFANQVYRHGLQSLSMAVSIGIATYRNNYESVEALLADTSMAERMARHAPGSSFRFIDADARVAARETYRLESALREGLAAKDLEPFLQPIVDLGSGEPVGFEALARWRHEGKVLQPDSFLPICAETGLTGDLDLLIIEKTLAALPLLAQPIPLRPMTINVNLSGVLLEDGDQRQRLLRLVDENPLPPAWTLQVELVEDAFQDTSAAFDDFLNALVSRGVLIAIDDFGTGYSSLARLISLPINGVKVDRMFVERVGENDDSPRLLLRTMLTMLNDLGMAVTAEGIEQPAQRDWLIDHGVSKGQGYLFDQPLTLTEAVARLRRIHYRPKAIPVEPARIWAARRRRLLRNLLLKPLAGVLGRDDRRHGEL
ncbi:MAG: sensor domain-containing phosphodiesterase [Cyanobium sp. M30B3]|jgi:diguanylate cyclase|nr:MAG: sensor domain-containing phosphodiesterase [Cyanobium sp. M30B3]